MHTDEVVYALHIVMKSNFFSLCVYRSIRVVVRASAEFSREVAEETQHVSGHFSSHPQLVASAHDFDVEQLTKELNTSVENFNTTGSSFVLDHVTDFTIVITQYRPLSGSTYIPTPSSIVKKKAIINVKNHDNRCFEYAILSCLYPANRNSERTTNYTKYLGTLNFDGISFPVKVKDLPKFEKQNPEISVNIISQNPETKGYSIDYMSPERQRRHHINLLLLYDSNTETTHYTWIKNFSRLLGDRTNHTGGGANHVCNSCLNVFSSQRVLNDHIPNCLRHNPQMVIYPNPADPDECTLKFKDHDKEHPLKFYLVCDFESFLVPNTDQPDADAKTQIIDEHSVSGFCCHRVTDIEQYQTLPTLYSGPDVMSRFYEHIMSESSAIDEILSHQVPISPMSDDDLKRHRAATTCFNCNCPFTHQNYRVKHHCHVTGQYLFPSCNNCNLQLKPKKCKNDKYFLPIIFHNLHGYDSHYILKHFEKRHVQKTGSKGHKTSYEDIKVIPLNGERFLQFQIGNVKFLDSFLFLNESLEYLVSLLFKSGKENFHNTTKYLGDHDLVFAKGVYPYSYMTDSRNLTKRNCHLSKISTTP